jgi:hypothetical protein
MNSAAAAAEPASPRAGRGLTLAPILHASSARIRELGARRGTSLAHIKGVVESDPAVALNLFAQVNADLKRAGHSPVGDIPRAILFMGMAELPGRLTRASVLEDVVGPGLGEELTGMLCRAHHASRQARAIGALAGGLNGDELLAASLTREGLPYLERLAAEPGNELNLTAFNNFPPAPPDSHDARVTTMRCLDFAARFADATGQDWDDLALDELYAEIGDFTGRKPDDVARSLRRTTVEAARAGGNYPSYAPALHLMSPGRVARAPEVTRTRPAPVARKVATPPLPPVKQAETVAPQTTKDRAAAPGAPQDPRRVLHSSLARIARSAAAGETAAALLPLALQAICDATGMRLALLLMRDRTSTDLWLRAHRGLEIPAAVREQAIPLNTNPLLGKLMAKPAGFQWLPGKHARALAGLPLKLLGNKPAFLYSLHVEEKPLGILIGCRPQAADGTLDTGFAAFKQIAVATRNGLQQSHKSGSESTSAT